MDTILPTWRLVTTPPLPGALNMAIDEALLEQVSIGASPPVLRLYAWDPPCLSLGYGQLYNDVDEPALRARGWDAVRRPTGGRAILHTDELTYSVTAPPDHPLMQGGILASYERLSSALLRGLQLLAVPAAHEQAYALPAGADPRGPVCFEVPSNWEITVDGKKLVGSAQMRRSAGVLQHGTLPLTGDLARITQVLTFPDESERAAAAERLLARAVTVETALGRTVSWSEAAEALPRGFAETLHVTFEESGLLENEQARAEILTQEKYGSPRWTERRRHQAHSGSTKITSG